MLDIQGSMSTLPVNPAELVTKFYREQGRRMKTPKIRKEARELKYEDLFFLRVSLPSALAAALEENVRCG